MDYVDERGEHSGLVSEATDLEEQRCRLRTISNNQRWLRVAVELGDDLIELAQRSGDADAWGCTSGYYSGDNNPGPNLMARTIKSVTGVRPPKPPYGPLVRPEQGRWSVHQVMGSDVGDDNPRVAIWHSGFSQNPRAFPQWCQAITAGPRTPTLILADSPILRTLARHWNAGELSAERQGWTPDDIADYVGTAVYVRTRASAVLKPDGTEISGDRLVAATAFLRARHQLRISPFDLLDDPLLAAQLGTVKVNLEDPAWTPREKANLVAIRQRYDRPQRVLAWLTKARQSPPVDVFSTGDSFPASIDGCLQTAKQALATGQLAPVLISSWTGWALSALERGERPAVPASLDGAGRLVDWYRQVFRSAVAYDLVDGAWFASRETWHADAFRSFPGELTTYYNHIYSAERALARHAEQQRLTVGSDLHEWYQGVFQSAVRLGLATADETKKEAS